MATADDWTTRFGRLQDQVNIQLPALITNYEMKTRAVGDLVKQVDRLEDEKGRIQREIRMAEQDASTADREFLEKKQTFPDPFTPSKIYTIQDFTFYLFFISYLLLLVAVSMVFQEKMKTFLGGIVLLGCIVVLLFRYI